MMEEAPRSEKLSSLACVRYGYVYVTFAEIGEKSRGGGLLTLGEEAP